MSDKEKKRFFLSHKKSSALMVSIMLHVVFIVVAITFVAVKVYVKPEQTFVVPEVNRPQMKLRKLVVPVKDQKKTQAPKLRHTIVTKPKYKDVTIKMPEIVGVPGGTGYGRGEGLGGLGFGFELDLFGSSRGTGNEFIGYFYDLKQEPDGKLTDIGEAARRDSFSRENQLMAAKLIRGFVSSGFNEGRLKNYFKAPKSKYATAFMMPPMQAEAAPKAFGVEDQVQAKYWICHYSGQIAAPETGRYRFNGICDDILIIRAGNKVVLDGCWPELIGESSSWQSRDDNSRLFPLNGNKYRSSGNFKEIFEQLERGGGLDGDAVFGNVLRSIPGGGQFNYMSAACRMVIGDWMSLRKGQLVDVDIVIGEIPGGEFNCRILIEQEGVQYKMTQSDAGMRPVLPVFKTTEVAPELVRKMELDPNEMTLEGPVFGALINTQPGAGTGL